MLLLCHVLRDTLVQPPFSEPACFPSKADQRRQPAILGNADAEDWDSLSCRTRDGTGFRASIVRQTRESKPSMSASLEQALAAACGLRPDRAQEQDEIASASTLICHRSARSDADCCCARADRAEPLPSRRRRVRQDRAGADGEDKRPVDARRPGQARSSLSTLPPGAAVASRPIRPGTLAARLLARRRLAPRLLRAGWT
jgi:hypothetical protein